MRKVRLVHIVTSSVNYHKPYLDRFRYLGSTGFDVIAVASPDGSGFFETARDFGVTPQPVAMVRQPAPLKDLLSLIRVWSFLVRIKPDIVHCQSPKAGLIGMIAAWLAGAPVRILSVHGLRGMTETGFLAFFLGLSLKVSCALANKVLCDGARVREVLIASKMCKPDKVTVLHKGSANGVDAVNLFNPHRLAGETREKVRNKFGVNNEDLVVGFLGRIVPDKGIADLSRSWESLKWEFPSLHLLLVGQFEEEQPLPRALRDSLMSDAQVHFAGSMSFEETPMFYAAMDIVVLPSYREGFSAVPIESGAMELPVVVSDVPGASDAVKNGVNGLVVPSKDCTALSKSLRELLQNVALRKQMGLEGRRRVLSDFQPEDVWKALADEYLNLAKLHGVDGH